MGLQINRNHHDSILRSHTRKLFYGPVDVLKMLKCRLTEDDIHALFAKRSHQVEITATDIPQAPRLAHI